MMAEAKQEIKVVSVNISREKGTVKLPEAQIVLTKTGVEGDAHAGSWHRMVSLLGTESFEKFEKQAGRKIAWGEFAENITTQGIILHETAPFDQFVFGDILLEVTQIGKKCHGSNCAIFREVGNCVMPKEGIFVRVLQPGTLRVGDRGYYIQKVFKVMVVTLSDRASKGEYEDLSGPEITSQLNEFFNKDKWNSVIENVVIPDDPQQLQALLKQAREEKYDMVFTTGGTGIGPRDFTPEVIKPMLDKEIPGIMEAIRFKFGLEKPNALLSRGIAGVMADTLVYVLPGSVKAVREYMNEIKLTLRHLLFMQRGVDIHH